MLGLHISDTLSFQCPSPPLLGSRLGLEPIRCHSSSRAVGSGFLIDARIGFVYVLTPQRGIMATPSPALLRSRGRPSPLHRT